MFKYAVLAVVMTAALLGAAYALLPRESLILLFGIVVGVTLTLPIFVLMHHYYPMMLDRNSSRGYPPEELTGSADRVFSKRLENNPARSSIRQVETDSQWLQSFEVIGDEGNNH
jgi:hypothetical protein